MLMRLLTAMVTVLALVATACGATEPPPPSSTVTTPDGPTTTLSHVDPEPPAVDPAPGWTVAFEAGTPWGPDGHGEGGYWESGLLVGEKGLLVTAIGEGEGSGVVDLYRSNERCQLGATAVAFASVPRSAECDEGANVYGQTDQVRRH